MPDTKTQLNEALGEIKNRATSGQLTTGQINQVGQALSSNAPITSDTLSTEPSFNLPATPPTSPETSGLLGFIGSQTDSFTKGLEQQQRQAERAKESSQDQFLQSLLLPGEAQLTEQALEDTGANEFQREVTSLNNQLLAEQRALDTTIRDIQDAGGGLVSGQNIDIQKARSESLRRQADIAVVLNAKQGQFADAKAIADRAVRAQIEQQRNVQRVYETIYNDNKELFNKSEQRLFETQQRDRERAIDREEENLSAISDMSLDALQNGAPTSVVTQMRQAESVEEAITIGGRYIGAYDRRLKQLQIANVQSQIKERQTPTGQKLTASQASALGYANRLLQSSTIIDDIGDQFTGLGSIAGGFLPNTLKSSERQQYEQAQRNFINAVLRRESGAAIAPSEFDNAALQYFPQPGDSQEVLLQKKQNRDLVAQNFLREGGQDTALQDQSLQDPLQLGITNNSVNPLGI